MKKKLLISVIIAFSIFIVMFIFRFIFGYYSYPSGLNQTASNDLILTQNSSETYQRSRKNIATKKYQDTNTSQSFDQKYEKIADLSSLTSNFELDEKNIKDSIQDYKALIQDEQKSGLQGNRYLSLTIGVPPNNFDSMIESLSSIGRLVSINIVKRDKTNEYKELSSKQETLVKTRDSLIELKERNASVEDLINLETRILEIENEIQTLGVSLGEFDEENEFCTINIKLSESSSSFEIPVIQRIKVALEWTIQFYLMLAFAFLFFTGSVLITLKLAEKLKLLEFMKQLLK
jgi:hypothetical protein